MDAHKLIGKTVGGCTLQKVLGQGRMSAVYLAAQMSSQRQVAVKVLQLGRTPTSTPLTAVRVHFQKECQFVSSLAHPHVLQYEAYNRRSREPGLDYIMMPYIDGGTLLDDIRHKGPLPLSPIRLYLKQIAEALDYAHERGAIHGDLKTEKILRRSTNDLVVSGFGLAWLRMSPNTAPGPWIRFAYASDYRSPEQHAGQEYDGRADQYALGVILFEMLTGKTPAQLLADRNLISKLLNKPLPRLRELRPGLPNTAEEVLLRALAEKPADRYNSVGEFAAAFSSATGFRSRTSNSRKRNVDAKILQNTERPVQTTHLAETSRTPAESGQAATVSEQPVLKLTPYASPESGRLPLAKSDEIVKPVAPSPRRRREPLPPRESPSRTESAQPAEQDSFVSHMRQAHREAFQKAMDRADDYRWNSQWSQAADAYRQALGEFPDDVLTHTGLGFCLMQMGEWKAALHEYEQALKRDFDNLIATQKMAELYVLLKQPAEVYQTYMRLADLYAQAGQQVRYEATWQKIAEFSLQEGNPPTEIPFEVTLRGGEAIGAYLKAMEALSLIKIASMQDSSDGSGIHIRSELPDQEVLPVPGQVSQGSHAPEDIDDAHQRMHQRQIFRDVFRDYGVAEDEDRYLPAPGNVPPAIELPTKISSPAALPDWLTGILDVPADPLVGRSIFIDADNRQPLTAARHDVRLILVGEGSMGKSSLLRSLKQQSFDPELPVTHGIQVDTLRLTHPEQQGRELILSTWDFGGQQIYQATHQLFLTRRSIYLLVWNARQGPEVCRLRFWLDTINALAPKAPILLIATHADEWQPEIDLPRYQQEYPQLVGQCNVSNKNGHGLDALKQQLLDITAGATLVGQKWPQKWLDAERALFARSEQYLDRAAFFQVCGQHAIEETEALGSFALYLHDLGKILFFADDPLLSNLVVLKPQWISQAISAILDDEQVRQAHGLLNHSELTRIWTTDEDGNPYNPALYPAFLRLMERFDLCYQLEPERPGARITHSLVPLLLPPQPPLSLPWPPHSASADVARAEIRYTLDFVPAGLMSWLLVRTHRYSQQLHWRGGAHLAYQGQQAHLELDPDRRELQLISWGPFPYTFFLILKETLDALLERFQNVRVKREIPCTCQFYPRHPHFHFYDVLEQRLRAGESEIVCQQGSRISLLALLYGLHAGSAAQITATVEQTQEALIRASLSTTEIQRALARIEQGQEFLLRDLAREQMLLSKELLLLSRFEMQREQTPCPGLFLLEPEPGKLYNLQDCLSRPYRLRLLCQYPAGPHTLKNEPGYLLRESKEWWKTMSPWLRRLVTVLKTGLPLGKAVGAVFDQVDVGRFATQIDLLNEILNDLPSIEAVESVSDVEDHTAHAIGQRLEGAALRALAHFLHTADPAHHWHGLQRVVTADRTILWVCEEHAHIGETL